MVFHKSIQHFTYTESILCIMHSLHRMEIYVSCRFGKDSYDTSRHTILELIDTLLFCPPIEFRHRETVVSLIARLKADSYIITYGLYPEEVVNLRASLINIAKWCMDDEREWIPETKMVVEFCDEVMVLASQRLPSYYIWKRIVNSAPIIGCRGKIISSLF